MVHELEVVFKKEFEDARATSLEEKVNKYFTEINSINISDVYLFDMDLDSKDLNEIKDQIFVDPVTQKGSYSSPIFDDFDWLIFVGFLPGVKDNVAERSEDAINELLDADIDGDVYTAKNYYVKGNLDREDVEEIANDLLSNDLINKTEVLTKEEFEEDDIKNKVPKVKLNENTNLKKFNISDMSVKKLEKICEKRNFDLNINEIRTIKDHFDQSLFMNERADYGLSGKITDVELEIIAQTQSEHCKHKIFNSEINYVNKVTEEKVTINSLFNTYIKGSTEEIDKDWILSVFWDNAGVIEFNDDWAVSMKFETHNSPSAKEPYGGAETGIVGVYRDILGAGKGSKLIAGSYGFCTPDPFYDGNLNPEIPPRRLLEGVVEGVRDGGNKSGVPTIYGYSKYDNSFLGKPLVYVGSVGLMPKEINEEQSWEKDVEEDDLIVMIGGRVGKDGIHGVTESSLEFGEHITASHVQIGDPFTQKKVHDFMIEARDLGLYKLTWDIGGGGLSSAVGESAEFSNGCELHLDKVPLKYKGLDPWEIIISESQERMILGVDPGKIKELEKLAKKHDVEITSIGKYKNTGKFHVLYRGETVAYLDMEFLHKKFPRFELKAEWNPEYGKEPEIKSPENYNNFLKEMLSRKNIASKEWIQRQYDHEVQGTSVIKPYVGIKNDVKSDASVIKPLKKYKSGLALSLGNNFKYSQIDPYWMAASSLDESIRRILSVGASIDYIALNDNFCWPNSIQSEDNPEGKENLGKLVRANKALYKFTKKFKTPCISGKDSMFIGGELKNSDGETEKVSGLPALQFAALGKVKDVSKSISLTPNSSGDLIYVIGETKDELGASEYYEMKDEIGLNVPKVDPEESYDIYKAISEATEKELLESCTGCYRGGLGISLAKKAMAGDKGLKVDLSKVPTTLERDDKILFSETPSRFIVTIKPEKKRSFEKLMKDIPHSKIGSIRSSKILTVKGIKGDQIIEENIKELKKSYKKTFGDF